VFLTAAFGVTQRLRRVFLEDRDPLRYVLLGIDMIIRDGDPDNQVSVGANLPAGKFGQWVKESTLDLNHHVRVQRHLVSAGPPSTAASPNPPRLNGGSCIAAIHPFMCPGCALASLMCSIDGASL
jgi:hypothetical protein